MTAPAGAARHRIVVGVDGSKPSVQALLWAQRLASTLDAEIDAVLAWQYPLGYGEAVYAQGWDPEADAARVLADTVHLAFGDDAPAGLRTSIERGHPAHVLIHASLEAELLVLGSRGHGGFVGLLIGATSAYCSEHATCSVLVTHNTP